LDGKERQILKRRTLNHLRRLSSLSEVGKEWKYGTQRKRDTERDIFYPKIIERKRLKF
jgi:DNA-directed RNA polymerase sigma subunit (sigma70/sigma32)